ncbi:MAG: tRNA1(Val) (adenine(37)-N6)-methyltransferase, partial [Paracoccaceae bacterium]
VHEGDITRMPKPLRRDFDHVIANPPYYAPGGSPSPLPGRATAMQVSTPLGDWVTAAARRLRPGGWLTMICGTDGLPEVMVSLGARLGSAAVLPLAPREGRAALRVLFQARKGARAPFRLLAPLVLHRGAAHDGDRESYTPEANAVLRGGADLLAHFR